MTNDWEKKKTFIIWAIKKHMHPLMVAFLRFYDDIDNIWWVDLDINKSKANTRWLNHTFWRESLVMLFFIVLQLLLRAIIITVFYLKITKSWIGRWWSKSLIDQIEQSSLYPSLMSRFFTLPFPFFIFELESCQKENCFYWTT